jgi:hypothetical protein
VGECVVLVSESEPDDKRLVAYIVPADDATFDSDALRAHLKALLPPHMIPSAFVRIENMPLASNGKIDKGILLRSERPSNMTPPEFASARTATERTLRDIWAEVLKVDSIGIRDNFFEIGGYSLLIPAVLWRVHDSFGIEMTIRSMFEHPTIEGFARELSARLLDAVSRLSDEDVEALLHRAEDVPRNV